MKILPVLLLFGCILCDRQRRTITALLDLIEDYCEQEVTCISDVTDDIILVLTGRESNDDLDSEISKEAKLWESIDERCKLDAACLESLFEDLVERVVEDPIELSLTL